MRKLLALVLAGALACSGGGGDGITGPPVKKPGALDPYLTVLVRNMMDTTTAAGRAHWHVYAVLTSTQSPSQEGVTPWGAMSLPDVRLGHTLRCGKAASDSIGNRLISLVALADTTTDALTPDAAAQSLINQWFAGNTTLPAGWRAIVVPPVDAWDSQQFTDGHGLVPSDPIKWGWDWTGAGASSFYERTDSLDVCNSFP